MKIFFGTGLDNPGFPSLVNQDKPVSCGEEYMGPEKLISWLCLHLGISTNLLPQSYRIEVFKQSLEEYLKTDSNAFYRRSFETDGLGTATYLLSWRDQLKIAGWNFKAETEIPERLKAIALIESRFKKAPGKADLFPLIIASLQEKDTNVPLEIIQLHEDPELLDPAFQQLFNLFKSKGVKIDYRKVEGLNAKKESSNLYRIQQALLNRFETKPLGKIKLSSKDSSIRILTFKDDLFASQWLCKLLRNNPDYKPLLLAGLDALSLDKAFHLNGLPPVGSTTEKNSASLLQVFRLIHFFLWKPVDPYKLLEFLNLELSPVSRSLCKKLAEIVASSPGINGERWNNIITEYLANIKEHHPDKHQKLNEKLEFWFSIEAMEENPGAPVDRISKLYNELGKWARESSNNPHYIHFHSDFKILFGQCKELKNVLESYDPQALIPKVQLEKWVDTICTRQKIAVLSAKKGALDRVLLPENITAPTSSIIWWNCFENNLPTYSSPWTKAEEEYLKKRNVQLYSVRAKSQLYFRNNILPVFQAQEQVLLLIPEKSNGSQTGNHPLLSALRSLDFDDSSLQYVTISVGKNTAEFLAQMKLPEFEETEQKELPAINAYWNIQPSKQLLTEKISYSSLALLLQSPYQWFLQYEAKIWPGSFLDMVNEFAFKGNLAHRICEIFFSSPENLKLKDGQIRLWVKEEVQKLLPQEGAIFLMKGKENELQDFTGKLQNSISDLTRQIWENGWTVEGTEKKIEGHFEGFAFTGSIDLLLKNKAGKKAIIDLKWTLSSRKYQNILKEEKDMQLALYAAFAGGENENPDFCATAYYLLAHTKMYTRNKECFKDAIIVSPEDGKNHVDVYRDLTRKIKNSLKLRLEEIASGKLEVGEGIELDELDYHLKCEANPEQYFPLEADNQIKKISQYNSFTSFLALE